MLYLAIMGLFFGTFSVLFLVSELHLGMDNFKTYMANRNLSSLPWYKKMVAYPAQPFAMLYVIFICFKELIFDVALTIGILALFTIGGGIIGVLVALNASGIVSGYLYWRRRKEGKANLSNSMGAQADAVHASRRAHV